MMLIMCELVLMRQKLLRQPSMTVKMLFRGLSKLHFSFGELWATPQHRCRQSRWWPRSWTSRTPAKLYPRQLVPKFRDSRLLPCLGGCLPSHNQRLPLAPDRLPESVEMVSGRQFSVTTGPADLLNFAV